MKIGLNKATVLNCCLLVLVLLLASACKKNVRVDMGHSVDRGDQFVIAGMNDPINVAAVVESELFAHGFSNVRVSLNQIQPLNRQVAKPKPAAPTVFTGSGFLISDNGYILTNNHVIEGMSELEAMTPEGDRFKVMVIVKDKRNDLAILQPVFERTFDKWLPMASFNQVALGDSLHIVGYPLSSILGKQPRVSEGIVSSSVGIGDDPTLFQISAPVQPGNSGGPILDSKFRVVGVVTSRLSDLYTLEMTGALPQNINFGVKIDYAENLFTNEILKSIQRKNSRILKLEDAIGASVFIQASNGKVPTTTQRPAVVEKDERIIVTMDYRYKWDVFHNMLTYLRVDFVSAETGKVIATGIHSGETLFSYVGTTEEVVQQMLQKAGFNK